MKNQVCGRVFMNYTHKTVFINGHGKEGEEMAIDIERAINLLEYEGWEYVNAVSLSAMGNYEIYLIFRRERSN